MRPPHPNNQVAASSGGNYAAVPTRAQRSCTSHPTTLTNALVVAMLAFSVALVDNDANYGNR
jgi:hypothetical protein